jgi:GST-like protein
MIDVYYWTTPNGHKITIFLEEAEVPYNIVPVDITKGEQFQPSFLRFSPNNRIPAMIDRAPNGSSTPLEMFDGGAMLIYLAEKTGKFLPQDLHKRYDVLQWLFWQASGLGPMAGQAHHFGAYLDQKIPYAIDRFRNETARLYAVLNKQLADREFVAGGAYSIADMACYPWILLWQRQQQVIDDFPNLKRWLEAIGARPAVIRAYERGKAINTLPAVTEESKKVLFGQTAAVVRP